MHRTIKYPINRSVIQSIFSMKFGTHWITSNLNKFCRVKMPKRKETYREFISRMAETYKSEFVVDNSVLYCKLCESQVTATKLSGVKQHMATDLHKNKLAKRPAVSQTLISKYSETDASKTGPKLNPIFMDVCELFLEADIPLKKLRHPTMQRFLEKYTKSSPSETTIRNNYVPIKYKNCIDKLRAKADGKFIWVSMDETTDVEQRLVANFVFGILNDESERGKCYLLDVRVVETNDGNTMATFFNDCMLLLFPKGKLNIFCGIQN